MRDWAVLALALAYLALLFLIAWAGDRRARARPAGRAPAVYALSIGVYCTSWTLYGAVGVAAEGGLDYLAIYVGPILVFGLGWPLIARMIRIARAENVVSISDFISARYGKSRTLAVLVTVTAVVGLLPYFALQLKAITISFEALASDAAEGAVGRLPGGTTLIVAVAMSAFAVLFGVRSVNANEPHRGLMLAVAVESVVKLAAAVLVGGSVAFFAFGDVGGLMAAVRVAPELGRLLSFDALDPVWWATCLLAAVAFLCLPRQFHVAVVENTHLDDVRTASWAFPLYLVVINLFVLPVALVGLTLFPGGAVQPDTFLVAIPRELGWSWLAFVAFLGGLSAATGMIIVATLALGTMVSNDVILPALANVRGLRERWEANPGPALLLARRVAVVGIMALAYGCYLVIGSAFPLAAIGLISFAAVAQFAPALLGGMFWRRATAAGAFAGIGAGFLGWVWTVAVPAFATAGWLSPEMLAEGPFGVTTLSPLALGGLRLDPLLHGMLWSLGPNLALFVAVSLMTEPSAAERRQAERFVGMRAEAAGGQGQARAASLADLHELAARYVGRERADATFRALALARAGVEADESLLLARSDAEAVQVTERLLAGAIGSASARVVVASQLADRRFSRSDARELIGEASRAILGHHELMRDAMQNIRQGLCAFDEVFRVTLWNRRFLALLDLPADIVRVGTSLEEIVRYNEARGEYGAQGEFDTLLARRRDPERAGKPDLYERRRPDGTVLEISTNPMPSGGFVAVYTDTTERYRAAAALREANEALEARVDERTVALSAAKAEAERANVGKTRFLAAVGHDLLQPLQAARLFLSALAERSVDPAVGQIDASLDSVEHLLGELLEVSKLDSGVTTPSFADFRVADVLRPLGEEFSALAREHGLGFRAVASSASVRSDAGLLRRILQNFLANALRYTGQGRVLVGCRRRGGELALEVWDTGPGIPEDKLRDIFLEFHRLESGADRGEGLGLGLSIVERLASLMGHRVEVRSWPGRGSCFAVRVPLAAAPVAAAVPAARAQRRFDGALMVFVENEAAIAGAMGELLAGWSCEVVAAATAEAALERLGGRRPDVILSDYHLDHGRTGLEALATLRARLGPVPPAALITADRDPRLRVAAEAGGYRLLHKPVRPGALRALLAQMLAERAGRAAE
jgi:Na+/proline symporter/signal transduction histidine kinase